MTDKLSPEKRSMNMSAIRSVGMKPEMVVRRIVHNLGYRFRLHRKNLAGKPDLVLTRHRKIIFVHGCFWHQHQNCRDGRLPKSNVGYWQSKLSGNIIRDKQHTESLESEGWQVLVIWECETRDEKLLIKRLKQFLSSPISRKIPL